jgi:transcriptional regulator with XRE-family HTH domain
MKNQFDETLHLFGATLRSIRKSRGISQEKLAHICCLDRTYISGLELGKRNPTLKVLASIANHLNISLSDLLPDVNDKK